MAEIVINDLAKNDELDREMMRKIRGGKGSWARFVTKPYPNIGFGSSRRGGSVGLPSMGSSTFSAGDESGSSRGSTTAKKAGPAK